MIRYPATEGSFYPSSPVAISSFFRSTEKLLPEDLTRLSENEKILAAVLPHAGHMYCAYHTIAFLKAAQASLTGIETVILLHPNHKNRMPPIALTENSAWVNCLGKVMIDTKVVSLLPYPQNSRVMSEEHSAEVIVPYLQHYLPNKEFRLVPICIADASLEHLKGLAGKLREVQAKTGRKILIVASSDFSHFLRPDEGYSLDSLVLDKIAQRDAEGVEKVVRKHDISVCGYRPIITAMEFAKQADDQYESRVIARGHSGEVNPSLTVVDYISIAMFSQKS